MYLRKIISGSANERDLGVYVGFSFKKSRPTKPWFAVKSLRLDQKLSLKFEKISNFVKLHAFHLREGVGWDFLVARAALYLHMGLTE